MAAQSSSEKGPAKQGDFQPIDEPKERQRLLGYAAQSKADLHLRFVQPESVRSIRLDGLSFSALAGSDIVTLASVKPIDAKAKADLSAAGVGGCVVECLFGLSEGEFVLKAAVIQLGLASLVIKVVALEKLQRRENFRVSTAAHPTFFSVHKSELGRCLTSNPGGGQSNDGGVAGPVTSMAPENSRIKTERFRLVDLSVGGMRVIWSASHDLPLPDCEMGGELELHTGLRVPVSAKVIRIHTSKDGTDTQVSLAFDPKSLDQDATRSILFTCTQISRRF